MTVDQLMEAVGEIDDSYVMQYTQGVRGRSRIPWGLISAVACFCLVIGSVVFLHNMGLMPYLPGVTQGTEPPMLLEVPIDPADPWVYPLHAGGALSESSYYYREELTGILRRADLTGEGVPAAILCDKEGCTHSDRSCGGKVESADSTFFFTDGYLYYLGPAGEFNRCDADGNDRKTVGVLSAGGAFPAGSVDVREFVVTGSYLYYAGNAENTQWVLGRIRLETGADALILALEPEAFRDTLSICAARDEGVLLVHTQGTEADKTLQRQAAVQYWSSGTGEITALLQRPEQELQQVQYLYGTKLYYHGSTLEVPGGRVYTYDLVSGQVETAFENASLFPLGGGYAVVQHHSYSDLISLDTRKWHRFRAGDLHQVLAVSEHGVVLRQTTVWERDDEAIQTVCSYGTYADIREGMRYEDWKELFVYRK